MGVVFGDTPINTARRLIQTRCSCQGLLDPLMKLRPMEVQGREPKGLPRVELGQLVVEQVRGATARGVRFNPGRQLGNLDPSEEIRETCEQAGWIPRELMMLDRVIDRN